MIQFDIDTKIKLNKERLNKDLSEIRKIQSAYSILFFYGKDRSPLEPFFTIFAACGSL